MWWPLILSVCSFDVEFQKEVVQYKRIYAGESDIPNQVQAFIPAPLAWAGVRIIIPPILSSERRENDCHSMA